MVARYRVFVTRVARVTLLTPHFVRVTLTGPELADFSAVGLDQRIKVMLPLPGHGFAALPEGPDIWSAWRALPDERRNPIRTYTVRAFRPDMHELDIDFVAHGGAGPASRWAASASAGDEVRIIGPGLADSPADRATGSAEFAPGHASTLLLAGDETAAPAICAILEALDVTAVGHAVIEVPADDDRLPVSAPAGVEVRWVARNGAAHGVGMTRAVHDWSRTYLHCQRGGTTTLTDIDVDRAVLWDVPERDSGGDVYAWIAGEAACVKGIRRHLVRDLGVDRKSIAFMGYWRQGRSEW